MIKNTSKLTRKVNVTSKKARSVDPSTVAKALGAEVVKKPPHVARFFRRGGGGGRVR